MHRRRLTAALAALMSLALAGPAGAASDVGPVSTNGRWLVDDAGRTLLVHGINVVAKRPPYTPESMGFDEQDAAFLPAIGMDVARVGVLYAGVEPQPGVYDDVYLDSIARTVAALARHGVRSLLDFHQDMFNERYQGQGFPGWAALDDGLPAQPQSGFPFNYFLMPALQHAYDHLWANSPGPGGVGLADRYAAAWAHVARRFAGVPGVLGYDLINEPIQGTGAPTCLVPGCRGFEQQQLAPFYAKVTAAIRAVDRATPISYEPTGPFGLGGPTGLPRLEDAHAVFGWHLYCPVGQVPVAGEPLSDPTCPTMEEQVFDRAQAHSGDREPQLISEFGSTRQVSTIARVQAEADAHLLGWMEWTYFSNGITDNGGTPNLVNDPHKPPAGANVDAAQLKVLARPRPSAVAGRPTELGYDAATRTLRLGYVPDARVTAPTRILVPAVVYPGGHEVVAENARVVRDRGGVAAVRATGTAPVRVVVRPGTPGAGAPRCHRLRLVRLRVPAGVRGVHVTTASHPPRRVRSRRSGTRLTVDLRRVRGRRVVVRVHYRTAAGHRADVRRTLSFCRA